MLARGMGEHCTVSQLVVLWQSPRNLGIEMSFLCDFPYVTDNLWYTNTQSALSLTTLSLPTV